MNILTKQRTIVDCPTDVGRETLHHEGVAPPLRVRRRSSFSLFCRSRPGMSRKKRKQVFCLKKYMLTHYTLWNINIVYMCINYITLCMQIYNLLTGVSCPFGKNFNEHDIFAGRVNSLATRLNEWCVV